ncbi:hypothetical protein chiPu_0029811 [Chiloscyllium punctatum]|uniref:Uncharacterized protein n=1 Tax=Chiloscyllium punctatum TaxID=137246 RepID=A0A401TS91_CHIPU|nr:hypothetical protein [Chiloscyllium punctatum]
MTETEPGRGRVSIYGCHEGTGGRRCCRAGTTPSAVGCDRQEGRLSGSRRRRRNARRAVRCQGGRLSESLWGGEGPSQGRTLWEDSPLDRVRGHREALGNPHLSQEYREPGDHLAALSVVGV